MKTIEQFFREELMAADEPAFKDLQECLPSVDDATLGKILDLFEKYGVEKTFKCMSKNYP